MRWWKKQGSKVAIWSVVNEWKSRELQQVRDIMKDKEELQIKLDETLNAFDGFKEEKEKELLDYKREKEKELLNKESASVLLLMGEPRERFFATAKPALQRFS